MNKKMIAAVVAAAVVIIGGAFTVTALINKNSESTQSGSDHSLAELSVELPVPAVPEIEDFRVPEPTSEEPSSETKPKTGQSKKPSSASSATPGSTPENNEEPSSSTEETPATPIIGGTGVSAASPDWVGSLTQASQTDQLIIVSYEGGSKATVSMHMKDYRGEWQELFSTLGYVGKRGIGQASEGNKVTPQGTFSISTVFGIKKDPGCKLEYTEVNKYHFWICESDSEYYNQMIDTRITDYRPKSQSIHIIDEKGRCNYCLAFNYNAEGIPGKGSAYFLHCIGNNKYTTGGISVPESIMKRILVTVQPQCLIVIDNKSTLTNS